MAHKTFAENYLSRYYGKQTDDFIAKFGSALESSLWLKSDGLQLLRPATTNEYVLVPVEYGYELVYEYDSRYNLDTTIQFDDGKCECGSGSNLIGPGHSDWCKRYRP